MRPMSKTPGGFRAALLPGWVLLGAAGMAYAHVRAIPLWAAWPVLVAFLLEYPLYLVPAFPLIREKLSGPRLPLFILAGFTIPYLLCCLGPIPFAWGSLIRLIALGLVLGLWYVVLPAKPLTDMAYLLLPAWVLLGKYLVPVYPKPFPGMDTIIIGHLGLVQATILCLMLQRRVPETGYGFIPTRSEWRIGLLNFACFLVLALPVGLLVKGVRWNGPAPVWVIAGTFLGVLWVTALSEEFFFRGVFQQWIEDWTHRRTLALLITSVLFGSVHLWFRGFPNWRIALLAAINGWFCGRARNQSGSIRAGMVTHTLVAVSWRAFFR